MYESIYHLGKYIQFFGLIRGFINYIRIRMINCEEIFINQLSQTVYLRRNTSDRILFEEIIVQGEYDLQQLKNLNPQHIIDIGANVGYTSIFFSNRFEDSKIIALEPEHENFSALCKNTSNRANIIGIEGGIWNSKCKLKVVNPTASKWAIQVTESDDDKWIQAYTIPELIEDYNIPTIDILKIDVEGTEKILFDNQAARWLSKTKVLIIETHDRIVPGSSTPVLREISKKNFNLSVKSDFLIFTNKDLV